MYNKENKNSKIINILLGVIAVFIIIFIVVWLVNRSNTNSNNNTTNASFESNLNLMQETAKEFFASNLPEEIGDSMQVTLQELYNIGAIDELKSGKDTCSPSDSYISITKTSSAEYRVKSNLVCGDKSEDKVEKIKSSTKVEDENGNTIIDSDKDDVTLDVDKKDDNNSSSNLTSSDGKTPNSTVNCSGPVCSFNLVPTNCTVTYEYQFVKRTVSCPEGYVIAGSVCTNSNEETKAPTPTYEPGGTKVVSAKKSDGTTHRVYIDPAIRNEDGEYYCTTGDLIGRYCYHYASKLVKYGSECPSGYNKVGNYCYKYANKTSSSCPAGYTDNGTNCYKRTNLITTGGSCPAGYTPNGNYCYKYANKITSGNTTCPSGTTPSNGKCLKTVTAVKSYSAWGNPVKTYQSSTKESTYTNELEKKVLLGSNKIGVTYVYTYAIYKRTIRYTCAQGTLTNGVCYVYHNPITTSTSTCPAGYTDNGTNCYIRQAKPAASTSCPSGYSRSGNYCYTYTNKNTGSCPYGYTDSGSTCYIRTNPSTTVYESCPTGYTESGNTCYRKDYASYRGGQTYYTCPAGYTQTGTGANTKCYRLETTEGKYYCENANATLKDNLCYITVEPTFKGNTCDNGFTLGADNLCHKTNTNTTAPIWSDVDYIYSYSDYVPGYQKTGHGKFVQHCTPITETPIVPSK